MADTCAVCGNGQLINGSQCDRCGSTMDDDGGGWSYDPSEVEQNVRDTDDTMRDQGFEWDDFDRGYRRR